MAASTRRCAHCGALNAEAAQECSLCGESLDEEVEAAPEPPALVGSRTADLAPQPRPVPPLEAEPGDAHYAIGPGRRRAILLVIGAGMGGAAGGFIVFVVYGFLGLLRFLPLVGRLGLLQPLAAYPPGVPGALAAIPIAILLGAIAGGVTTFRDSPRLGAVVFGALAVLCRALALHSADLARTYRGFSLVYGAALILVDGAFGVVCGYLVSLVVSGYLAATRQRPSD